MMSTPILRIKWRGFNEFIDLNPGVTLNMPIETTENWPSKYDSVKIKYQALVTKYEPRLEGGTLHLHYNEGDQRHASFLKHKDEDEEFHWGKWELTWTKVKGSDHATGDAYWRDDFDHGNSGLIKRAVTVYQWAPPNPKDIKFEKVSRLKRPDSKRLKELLIAKDHSCAITGESQSEVLDAVHIVPAVQGNYGLIGNAILLRTDLHRLFDARLINIKVSGGTARFTCSKSVTNYFKLVHRRPLATKIFSRIRANLDLRNQIFLR